MNIRNEIKAQIVRAGFTMQELETGSPVEITDVEYDFDPENIQPGTYNVTFRTEGYEYRVDTTDKTEVGALVGLKFGPEDLHVMKTNA